MRIEEQMFRIKIRVDMDHEEAKRIASNLAAFISQAFEDDVDGGILVDIPEVESL